MSTFLTTSLQKDDIFSHAEVSNSIELERRSNPYYLTSKVLSIGCGLSIGNQIYIDETNSLWCTALKLFLDQLEIIKDQRKADKIMLRGFNKNSQVQKIIEDFAGFGESKRTYNIFYYFI